MMRSTNATFVAEFDRLSTGQGMVEFVTNRTGLPANRAIRVLQYLLTQPVSEEWDLVAQAQKVGLSVADYGLAMQPLLQMSAEQTRRRSEEIQDRVKRGEDPGITDEEYVTVRKMTAFLTRMANLSGEEEEVVLQIYTAMSELMDRRSDITRLIEATKGRSPDG